MSSLHASPPTYAASIVSESTSSSPADNSAGREVRKKHFVSSSIAYFAAIIFATITANVVERTSPIAAVVLRLGALVLGIAWIAELISKLFPGDNQDLDPYRGILITLVLP